MENNKIMGEPPPKLVKLLDYFYYKKMIEEHRKNLLKR